MIYLTQEGKEKLEAKIAEIEKQLEQPAHFPSVLSGKLLCLKEILSTAVVLPQEKSWEDVFEKGDMDRDTFHNLDSDFKNLKNGVIINPNL